MDADLPSDLRRRLALRDTLQHSLRDLGYVDGEHLAVEARDDDQLVPLALQHGRRPPATLEPCTNDRDANGSALL